MSPHRPRLADLCLTGALGLALACGAPRTQENAPPTGFGQLALSAVDPPKSAPRAGEADEVHVRITQVTAHHSGSGWVPVIVLVPPAEVNLLTLDTPQTALDLGLVNLLPGTVTQIRLFVSAEEGANYIHLKGTDPTATIPLKVPSGVQSGIKINGPFEITECNRTSVTLDFDGNKSIWYHPTGRGDEWILRPVIHVKEIAADPAGCQPPAPPAQPQACGEGLPECPAGSVCLLDEVLGEVCAGPPLAPCTSGAECISSSCDETNRCSASGTPGPCYAATDCQSGACDLESHLCVPGDGPCAVGADCDSQVCNPDNTCAPPAGTLFPGDPCTSATASQCSSDMCVEVACSLSGQGDPCRDDNDCDQSVDTLGCVIVAPATTGTCQPPAQAAQ